MSDKPETVDFHGMKVTLVSDDEANTVIYCVCTTADTPSPWADNLFTNCGICGVLVQHRPYMPPKPMKICLGCFERVMKPS